jgi:hypothetical protein
VPARIAAPVDAGGFGRRPFTYVFEYPVTPRTAMKQALTTLAPALARGGYELVERDKHRLAFDYSYRPGWVAIPIILMPFVGLAALMIKEHDRVVVELEPGPGGATRMVISGTAPRRVRRAFAELAP